MAFVPAHWIVSRYTPATGEAPHSIVAVAGEIHETLVNANTRAKELAAQHPGFYYVVYAAHWFAYADSTPVALDRVGVVG